MTGDTRPALAEELTVRIAQVDGVHGVFPLTTPAPLLRRVLPSPLGVSALVDVDLGADGTSVTVTARLAASRTTPAVTVVDGVRAAVLDVVGDRTCALHVEIAAID